LSETPPRSLPQFVDVEVSRAKFDREVDEFRQLESDFRARGWLLLDADFPVARVVMCASHLKPPPVITGVEFDYSNYDVVPPAVTFFNPFSGVAYGFDELPTQLKRSVPQAMPFAPNNQAGVVVPQMMMVAQQPLLQPRQDGEPPFLCIAGVREYHAHPAHSGDAWELHREAGAGRFVRLLEVIHKYGVEPISDYAIQLNLEVTGLLQSSVPE
jgi:Predicted metal binding domain